MQREGGLLSLNSSYQSIRDNNVPQEKELKELWIITSARKYASFRPTRKRQAEIEKQRVKQHFIVAVIIISFLIVFFIVQGICIILFFLFNHFKQKTQQKNVIKYI